MTLRKKNSYLLTAVAVLEDAVWYFEQKIKQVEDIMELAKSEYEVQEMR